MGQSVAQKRPWLAAALSVIATGLGHLYLRRWKRAVAWLGLLFVTASVFVDQHALDSLTTVRAVDLVAVAPLLLVVGLNVLDAYFVAHVQHALLDATNQHGNTTRCPHCGHDVDPDLNFCHWCSATLDTSTRTKTEADQWEQS